MKRELLYLNILHVLNDGYQASFLLLLPFIAKDLHINLTQVGVLGTVASMFNLFLAIPAAYVAARIGGFRALILALGCIALGYILTSAANSYAFLIMTFVVAGLGFGVFHPIAFALIARWSKKETRGAEMGKFTAIGDVGRIGIATLITFIIAAIGWKLTSGLYGLVAAGVFVVVYIFHHKNREEYLQKKPVQEVRYKELLRNKKLLLASCTGTLDAFASSSLFVFIPFLFLQKGISTSILGSLTGAFFVGNFLGKMYLGKLVDSWGNTKTFVFAEVCMAIFIVVLANISSLFLIIPVSIILGALTKGTAPVIQTFVSDSVEHHGSFEKAFSVSQFIQGIGISLSPIVLGYISDYLGIIYAFYFAALFALLAVIPAFAFRAVKPVHGV